MIPALRSAASSTSSRNLSLLPKRLVLVRHGESVANVDRRVYSHTPDFQIELTERGHQQAVECGKQLSQLVGTENVHVYSSPYKRARQTLAALCAQLAPQQIVGEREVEQLREQDMGNYQSMSEMDRVWDERQRTSRFYFRFPNGESGADVCDRVSLFLDGLFREREHWIASQSAPSSSLRARSSALSGTSRSRSSNAHSSTSDHNVIIVCHGLFARLFLSRWFKLPVELFDAMYNPPNCALIVLERDDVIGRLVLREECKALFGNHPLIQKIRFDGTDNDQYYIDQFIDSEGRKLLQEHHYAPMKWSDPTEEFGWVDES